MHRRSHGVLLAQPRKNQMDLYITADLHR
jgi:hypothetical protein